MNQKKYKRRRKVKVALFKGQHILYLPLHLALHEELFTQVGLDVEVYAAGNDDQIHEEVATGKAEFGVGDPTFVALKTKSKNPTKVVAALVNNVSNWGLTHHAEIKPITSAKDMVGLRFGTFPKPSTSYALVQAIKKKHQKFLKSMQVIEAEIGAQLPLLSTGKAEVVIEVEPMVSVAESQGLRVVMSMRDFYPEFLFTGLMTSQRLIEENPQIVEAFVKVLQQALTLSHKAPEKVVMVAQKLFPAVTKDCLERAVKRLLAAHSWPEQALVPAGAWQAALLLRKDLGELKLNQQSYMEFLDQRFAYKAVVG